VERKNTHNKNKPTDREMTSMNKTKKKQGKIQKQRIKIE
jgi:hypothetical protein